ncbi:hypothetical protein DVH24_002663 [Malus domestica]|uniref:Co-chaperone protein p23 n=1 Tax=Malus domestica TaxID=3750 RepID=A0A498K9V4_MALDO|nr:hypothetical protein DVH24_002663 [Malus domestica]
MSRHPEVKWAQRVDKVFITVLLPDAKDAKVKLEPEGVFSFSASAGAENHQYELKLDLFDKVNVEESKINVGVRSIFCIVEKAEPAWWNKLLRGDGKTPHYVKVDWDKWVDEDDDTAGSGLGDMDLGGMDFSKFGGMGGDDMGGMGDFDDSDEDLELSKPEDEATDKKEAEEQDAGKDGAEMEATDMEVEERPPSNPDPFKRISLKNSIQTNFGDDYVFQIVPKDDWTAMAVSLSTNAVKVYSPVTGQYYGECKGHSATINQIAFSGPSTPHILHSCSSDGTIRAWDTRTFQQVSSFHSGSSQEIFSFSFGGSGNNLLAAGILFWDWRNDKQVACLEDSHVEDVTQCLHRHDILPSKICIGLMLALSIGKVGFWRDISKALVLTHIETLSIWDWKDASETSFQDARSLASKGWTLDNVDYFVDCHYSREAEKLWGPLKQFLEWTYRRCSKRVANVEHAQRIQPRSRHFWMDWREDGRLCCWLSDNAPEINRSWISSALVSRSPRTETQHGTNPTRKKGIFELLNFLFR